MSIRYNEDFGLFWPEWDQKAEANHRYIQKHLPTMDFAISQCKKLNLCVQAGGHVGIWAIQLAQIFDDVLTFEPEIDLFECLDLNMDSMYLYGVERWQSGLGSENTTSFLKRSTSSGANSISDSGQSIQLVTIDSLHLPTCDAIFLDIEGYELEALHGAKETITAYNPVIQVEELDDGEAVSLYLRRLGYLPCHEKQGKDRIYLPC